MASTKKFSGMKHSAATKSKIFEIAATLNMIQAKRFVNIRGYVREVIVSHKNKETGEWIVKDGNRMESIPEHLFYHNDLGGLILRDSAEFKRKFDGHRIEIADLPTIMPWRTK